MKTEKNKHFTKWAKEPVPFGAFQDYIIFESSLNNQFVMHELELDDIAKQLHTLFFEKRQIKYIQIFEEWHEGTGFFGTDDCVSILKDIEDTIDAMSYIDVLDSNEYGQLNQKDLDALRKFFVENKSAIISFKRE